MKLRGFTLVEVLVALVIVAAGAAAVLSSLNSAAVSTVYLRDKTFARWIAENRLAETRLATTAAQNGTTGGELEYAGQRWTWRQKITDSEMPGLRRVDVSVRSGAAPAAAAAAANADDDSGDWSLTISGILGRDVAPPGAPIDWEPPGVGPGTPGGSGAGATTGGKGLSGGQTSGAPGASGASGGATGGAAESTPEPSP